jgi:HK97 gp10 family phage protein
MKIFGSVSGSGKIEAKIAALSEGSTEATKNALIDAVLAVQATAIKSIQSHMSVDHIETRYKPKRQQEVSEPMAPPNSDLGKLAQSIEQNIDLIHLTGQVGTNLKYGAWLEFGTNKMAPRPWLYPAVQQNKDKIREMFETNFKDAISKAGGK